MKTPLEWQGGKGGPGKQRKKLSYFYTLNKGHFGLVQTSSDVKKKLSGAISKCPNKKTIKL